MEYAARDRHRLNRKGAPDMPCASFSEGASYAFAIGQKDDGYVWVRVVATVFGFLLILLVLSAFNVVLFSNAEEGSWRRRVPSIFVEIARLVLVVVGLAGCGTPTSEDCSRPSG